MISNTFLADSILKKKSFSLLLYLIVKMEYGYNISCFIFYVCPSLKKDLHPCALEGTEEEEKQYMFCSLKKIGLCKKKELLRVESSPSSF